MSATATVWAQSTPENVGSAADRAVLFVLADYAGWSGDTFPPIAAITRRTNLSTRTVQRSIRNLEAAYLIQAADPILVAYHRKASSGQIRRGWIVNL